MESSSAAVKVLEPLRLHLASLPFSCRLSSPAWYQGRYSAQRCPDRSAARSAERSVKIAIRIFIWHS